jgi:hypothetical protein
MFDRERLARLLHSQWNEAVNVNGGTSLSVELYSEPLPRDSQQTRTTRGLAERSNAVR